MIDEVKEFENILTGYFEVDDLQSVEIVIATAVSHKVIGSEMLWLRIIGASGSGKTELLRTLESQEGYTEKMEVITPSSIRRGYVSKDKGIRDKATLLERINGKLVITKEFAAILTKDMGEQKQVFGLLRGVHDGSLDADYGSDQGHIHQETHFDWILGTTPYVEKVRQLEYLLGSRFVDLKWECPLDADKAVKMAITNDGTLQVIRERLSLLMKEILSNVKIVDKPDLEYIPQLANISAKLRTPVERDRYSREIADLPSIELGTRMGQSLSRIARGLLMIGVPVEDIKPYINRLVFDSMTKVRAAVLKAWMSGVTKQSEIAGKLDLTQGSISRIVEDIKVLGWQDEWLNALNRRQ